MIIEGNAKCKVNKPYDYTFSAEDPEENQIYFQVYWGDGELSSFYKADSEGKITTIRIWTEDRNFTISAYPVDMYGYYGNSVTFDVNVTKNKERGKTILGFFSQSQVFNKLVNILKDIYKIEIVK